MPGSPAIDVTPSGPSSDYDGAARPAGVSFDMGAFEYGAIIPRMAVAERSKNIDFQIFPNPNQGSFQLKFDQALKTFYQFL